MSSSLINRYSHQKKPPAITNNGGINTTYGANSGLTPGGNAGTPPLETIKFSATGGTGGTDLSYSANGGTELPGEANPSGNSESSDVLNSSSGDSSSSDESAPDIDTLLSQGYTYEDIYNIMTGYWNNYETTALEAAKGIKDASYKTAEDTRLEIERQAEVAKERGVVDANSSYQQNMSTYGARAETLAQMGLTGSGYSEYLDAQNYASYRSDVQSINANTEKIKNDALAAEGAAKNAADILYSTQVSEINDKVTQGKLDANLSYLENMKAEEDAALAAYADILSGINSGAYNSLEQVKELATEMGVSGDRLTSLENAYTTYEKKTIAANDSEILSAAGDNIGAIQSAMDSGELSRDAGEAAIKKLQDANFDEYKNAIDYDFATFALTPVNANDVSDFKGLQDYADKGASKYQFTDSNGVRVDKTTADNILAAIEKNDLYSPDTKKKIKAAYDRYYTIKTSDYVFNWDGDDGTPYKGSYTNLGGSDNELEIRKGDNSDTKFKVISTKVWKEENPALYAVAPQYSEAVFGYDGEIYMSVKGNHGYEVYLLTQYPGDKEKYETLFNDIFE